MINTQRLQVILDEMAEWEKEIFEKEYADLNWYKGKQAKHVKEMEVARKRNKLGKLHIDVELPGLLLTLLHSLDLFTKTDIRQSQSFRARPQEFLINGSPEEKSDDDGE